MHILISLITNVLSVASKIILKKNVIKQDRERDNDSVMKFDTGAV